ncbi:MAG: D-aminoacylase [Melioribacteraceae bacterium]|nr:D-aminoacylase [Melioribacteraceae bacterium]
MKKINRRQFVGNTSLLTASTLLLGSYNYSKIIFKGSSFDIIIRNGMVIDGNGTKEFRADLGIKDGKIIAIENLSDASADRIINAEGLKVTPGFIDIHTHTDLGVLHNPKGESKIRQGVTTEISGNCGGSFGPVSRDKLDEVNERYGITLKDGSMGEFLNMLSNRKFSVNQTTLLGLGTIRELCVGLNDRKPAPHEMKRMRYETAKAIDEGAIGVSSGLEYTPGSFASTEELIEVCKIIPDKAKLYATHMRNEDNTVVEAVEEAIRIAKESGCRLELSHLKASGKSNWHKAERLLELMDEAVGSGLEVHADRYTYVAYHTGLANMFPLWSRDGGSTAFVKRLADKSLLPDLRDFAEKKASNLDGGWNGIVITKTSFAEHERFKGSSVLAISEALGKDPFETAVELLVNSEGRVSMVGFGMSETSTEKILAHPRVMIASDAGAHAPYPPMSNSIAHPRAYGTFPRAIAKYVRERNICPLEEMIRKMTSMPADKIGLKDRGRIAENKWADITVFDYNKIRDKATFIDSHQYPDGIPFVLVNGKIVIENSEHTGALPGKILTS